MFPPSQNYSPVSNLHYVSKLTEKVVFNQVYDHMASNAIFPVLQSVGLAPNMAATSFKALIFSFYFLAFCCEILSTWDYGRFAVTGRASVAFVAKRCGFHRAKFPLVSWTKRGCTSLLIPGHDLPLDITIF